MLLWLALGCFLTPAVFLFFRLSRKEPTLPAPRRHTIGADKLKKAYDYIVVGAGSSGCIVASGLAARGASVLLVEAGKERHAEERLRRRHDFWFANAFLLEPDIDWGYSYEPSELVGRKWIMRGQTTVLTC